MKRTIVVLAIAAFVLATAFGASARADGPASVTYTGFQTIPVPPASSYSGTGGGDGWSVSLTPAAVYNVFHHQSSWNLACHRQSDATPCWPAYAGDPSGRALTITDTDGSSFSTPGHVGLVLDHGTGKLYGFGTRAGRSGLIGGVICMDTNLASPTVNPFADGAQSPFCGFTALTGVGEAVNNYSGLSEAIQVGSRLYAFNFVPGSGVGPGAQNKLVCFDMQAGAACSGQPYTVAVGDGTNSSATYPTPAVTAVGGRIIIPITMGQVRRLACFDAAALGSCSGSWPAALGQSSSYPSSYGAAFPKLTASGSLVGLCLPMPNVPCFGLDGSSSATPDGITSAVAPTSGWNGGAAVIGPRVYVPNGNSNEVDCYDYNLGSSCPSFPKRFSNLSLLYTVNADPQRPDCLWVNADSGTQIQNFDAFSGGPCGQGAIRVLASSFVVDAPACTPGSYTTLQVVSPSRSSYTGGTVKFVDASGIAIPGVADQTIDANGAVSLAGVPPTTSGGLPQFLITLNGASAAQSVTVELTWTGTPDPVCAGKGAGTGGTTTTPTVAKTDVNVAIAAPGFVRVSQPAGFSTTVTNTGPDTATGVVLHAPIPTGTTLAAASSSIGLCVGGTQVSCYIGTLVSGASATVSIALAKATAGSVTLALSVEADHDTNLANNSGSATVAVLDPSALPPPPPPSAAPGTFNAIGSGTILVNGVPHPADQPFVLHTGDVVDVTGGIITFTDSNGKYGSWSAVRFVAQRSSSGVAAPRLAVKTAADQVTGKFTVTQDATPGALTTLTLTGGDYSVCSSPRKVAAKSQKPVQQLWGSAHGNFKTAGRFSAATVRGTFWMVQDRCDGTVTQVVEGIVDVHDSTLNKDVSVGPGESYLALAPVVTAPFKPPASTPSQTPKQVTKRGLVWGTKVYKTRKGFEAYLKARQQTWQQFAKAYPKLAAALNKRKK